MNVRRGDVVLLAFPFSSGTRSKVRPALVVQNDRNNERLQDTIVAMVTSTTTRAAIEPSQLLIDIAQAEGAASGLLHTSAIKCETLFTVEKSLILRTIGRLSPATMEQIDQCLNSSLGLG